MPSNVNSSNEKKEKLTSLTSDRKLAHLQICLEYDVQARTATTGLEDISFVHRATTDLNFEDIDLSNELFGVQLNYPLIISGMTGGHDFAITLNDFLSQAAHKMKIGMGVGSQRAALENAAVRESFDVVRENAPEALIIGNIGSGQIAEGLNQVEFDEIIAMIQATAIAIHFNPLQEALQLEGDNKLAHLQAKIAPLISNSSVPVIAKEVGSGFSIRDVEVIKTMGFSAIDIQGLGGTSWAGVESIRTTSPLLKKTGEIFWDWGIPTVVSTVLTRHHFDGPIIGSGGVRSGLDIAKLIALGADAGGMAIPFLFAAQQQSAAAVTAFIEEIAYQLRLACFLTGCRNIAELRKAPLIITGKTAEILSNFGIDPQKFLHRG